LNASVFVKETEVGSINQGLLLFLGVRKGDTEEDVAYLVDKILKLRIFDDDDVHFEKSALDCGAEILVVSQFTLYGRTRKGRRPDFNIAASPEDAKSLYELSVSLLETTGLNIETGIFRENMQISSINDGPVTLLLDSADKLKSRKSPE
jgi:D-tyrosyl-tRNA(Tyr) deacylase